MAKHKGVNSKVNTVLLSKYIYQLFDVSKKGKSFLFLIGIFILLCGSVYPYPHLAMWVGFGLAAYSAIANDSIQTIGTFIASNNKARWYYLWLFIGLIFVATVAYSWVVYDGDVSHQRLASKGFSEAPASFTFLQLSAPIILLILTRMRMPVSTTFLLLNVFAADAKAVYQVLDKSLTGYFLAFIISIFLWFFIGRLVNKYLRKKPSPIWRYVQWVTSGLLWSVWITQDAANIAIFLPRQLDIVQFIVFTLFIFLGLGILFYLKGDKIQQIVDEKAGITDVRAATLIDLIYAIILFYFKLQSNIPMSTTWVFIGLLGGRELAISFTKKKLKKRKKSLLKSLRMISKDVLFAAIGLIISLILAIAINPNIRSEIWEKLVP